MLTIIKQGREFDFMTSFENLKELPIGVYILKEGMFGRLYLETSDDFVLPDKIYHNDTEFIDHILHKYSNDSKNGNLGMLLTGKKGLGKTFTAKIICRDLKLPVIKITQNTKADIFNFLNKIEQPHIIFIDEFEKIFPNKSEDGEVDQSKFLSYLDGTNSSNTRKVFIITTNENINNYFLNRPSRLTYVRNYNSISKDVIVEVVNDLLEDEQFKEDLLENIDIDSLNIDILIKVIEEVNIMKRPYTSFKSFFNYSVDKSEYSISIINEDRSLTPITTISLTDSQIKYKTEQQHNPLFVNKNVDDVYLDRLIDSEYDKWEISGYYYDDENKQIFNRYLIKRELGKSIKYLF